MEATPATYRADISHTQEHIARIDSGDLLGDTDKQAQERRARLVRQLATLERALGRAEAASVACPDCGSPMRATRMGGGKRRQVAWICPRAQAEVSTDERGHQHRAADGVHPYTRVWTAAELA